MIKVFHLDDDLDILEIGRMALELNGAFEVAQCASSTDAIEAAAAFGPDVILLDVMLPGTSGIAVLDEFRKIPSLMATPVIFMTARVQTGEVDHLISSGASAVIPKPFDPISLGDQILDILNGLVTAGGVMQRSNADTPSMGVA